MMGVAVAVAAGCPPTKGGTTTTTNTTPTTTTGSASPLNFSAPDGNADCIYTYDTGSSSTPQFTLKYGGKGITVSASYKTTYESPPGTMQITYGDSSGLAFDTGQLTLFPTAGTGITVTENNPTGWTMTTVGSGPDVVLPWGKKWNITFSCGATPSCCANTPAVNVVADGTF
jgi:hypothetical protein